MANKIGGNQQTRYESFLEQFLNKNENIYKYEVKPIIKAFKLTLLYFIENIEEFEIKDFFKFQKIKKKEMNLYVRYRKEWDIIPEHEDMKFKTASKFRDYLNHRKKFKDSKHREFLPDGTPRKRKLF